MHMLTFYGERLLCFLSFISNSSLYDTDELSDPLCDFLPSNQNMFIMFSIEFLAQTFVFVTKIKGKVVSGRTVCGEV